MAISNKWDSEKALCPRCERQFGEWREGRLRIGDLISLLLPTTIRCECGQKFTYRPRRVAIPRPDAPMRENLAG